MQLPPSLHFDKEVFEVFIQEIRRYYAGNVFIEPRHESWQDCDFASYGILPVVSDPPFVKLSPSDPAYFRLHGSPRLYYSSYSEDFLQKLLKEVQNYNEAAIIFNNTTGGAAIENALRLMELAGETQ